MKRKVQSVETALEAIAEGRMVIVVDAKDRENEGDFLAAASTITPATIHFMISQGRGQLCMPVMPQLAKRLELTPLVAQRPPHAPCFAMPVDYRACASGVSPQERAMTVRAMLDPRSRASDFERPGHIFPLIARPEGVLRRPGHTEAAVDLTRLAGLPAAGVLCEICSRDGLHMAQEGELREISEQYGIPLIAIDELIEFRRRYERTCYLRPLETSQPAAEVHPLAIVGNSEATAEVLACDLEGLSNL